MSTGTQHYFEAGLIERPERSSTGRLSYGWRKGWSLIFRGAETVPWVTAREARAECNAKNVRAMFHKTSADAIKADRVSRSLIVRCDGNAGADGNFDLYVDGELVYTGPEFKCIEKRRGI